MLTIRLTPVFISFLLMAAHLLRMGQLVLAILILLIPLILLIKNKISLYVVQGFLLLSSLEWIRKTVSLIQMRVESEAPWRKMAIILGGVSLFTFVSFLILFTKKIKTKFIHEL